MNYQNYKPTTEEKATLISNTYRNHELLLHYLFMPGTISERLAADKNTMILFYCLVYQFVMAKQLHINTFTQESEISIVNRLYRLYQKKYLSRQKVQIDGKDTFIYFITEYGVKTCYAKMEKLLRQRKLTDFTMNFDNPSLSYFPSPAALFATLKGEAYEYFLYRASLSSRRSNYLHALAARDLNLFLLNNPYISPSYQFSLEAPISDNGSVVTREERVVKGINSSYAFRCDSLLTCPINEMKYYFYVEQDTGTQKKDDIQKKIDRYVNIMLGSRTDHYLNSVLFSIYTPSTNIKVNNSLKKDYVFGSSAVRDYMLPLNHVAYTIKYHLGNSDLKLKDIVAFCEKVNDSEYGNQFITNSLQFYNIILEQHPDISFDDFNVIVKKKIEKYEELVNEEKYDIMHKKYISRRNAIFRYIEEMDMDNIEDAFLRGFSIYTAHNSDYATTLPYLVPELLEVKKLLNRLIFRMYNIPINDTVFNSSIGNKDKDGLVLKNHYIYNSDIHLYIENISDDLGGRYRVKHYLNNPIWNYDPGILLCLISDYNDIAVARDIYLNTTYSDHVFSTAANDNSKYPSGAYSLKVFFTTYDKLSKYTLFTFDSEGNEIANQF